MVGQRTAALYTLNTTTGVATRVGSAVQFGVNESFPSGLASHGGVLYMVGAITDALYTLNTTTGVATRVGSATFGDEGTPTGLASHKGVLYMVGRVTDALYTLNTTTGVATRINPGSEAFGADVLFPAGLASHNDVLYMSGNRGFYRLNEAPPENFGTLTISAVRRGTCLLYTSPSPRDS